MPSVDQNTLHITNVEVLGKLPDPFLLNDGRRCEMKADWEARRTEIYKTAVELQYGTQPPKPEVFKVNYVYKDTDLSTIKIYAGTKEHQLSFRMVLMRPTGEKWANAGPRPVAVDGDMCFGYAYNKEYINTFLDNGVAFAIFDRTELASDYLGMPRRDGELYDIYPGYTFGSIGAWAWGYSRVVDALEELKFDNIDLNCIAFVGHSRGAKTAMLAGVLDERAKIVNPNETCAGACGCYRIHMSGYQEGMDEFRSERLCDLLKNYGPWLSKDMEAYELREEELPFDCHFLKALVAPRIMFNSTAAGDIWSNPIGAFQTDMAATEVWKALGVEQNYYWYFRKGRHRHEIQDVGMLVNLINHVHDGEPLSDDFYHAPFPIPEPIYDWKTPTLK